MADSWRVCLLNTDSSQTHLSRGSLRKSTDRNSLGSGIDGSDGSHRLRDTHARTSHKKPLFLDIAIGEIVNECGTNKISADAANLLIEVDKENNLGRIRRRMRGCEGMGREESREYRARAFAAAALHIRNSEGQSNTAPQVARDWGLRYSDLALAIKIINRFRRSRNAPPREPPASRRSRELRQEVERIRDYLSEQLEMESVIEVVDQTILRLRRAGEPFHPGDEWLTGHLCNDPPTRAAFECAIRSIADIGLPLSLCAHTVHQTPDQRNVLLHGEDLSQSLRMISVYVLVRTWEEGRRPGIDPLEVGPELPVYQLDPLAQHGASGSRISHICSTPPPKSLSPVPVLMYIRCSPLRRSSSRSLIHPEFSSMQ